LQKYHYFNTTNNFTLTFRSLSETFIRRSLFNSSSGSCDNSDATWQEIGRTCGSACSCPRPGSRIAVLLFEYVLTRQLLSSYQFISLIIYVPKCGIAQQLGSKGRYGSFHHITPQPFYGPFSGTTRVEPVPEENFWTLWCKGRLTDADTQTIRLGANPSGLTSAHLHHPPYMVHSTCG